MTASADRTDPSRAAVERARTHEPALPGTGDVQPVAHALPWQLDPCALVIRGLQACGLVWDVVRMRPERQQRKTAPTAARGGA